MTPVRVFMRVNGLIVDARVSYDQANVYLEELKPDRAGAMRWIDTHTFPRGGGSETSDMTRLADVCACLAIDAHMHRRINDGQEKYIATLQRQLRSARGRIGALTKRLNKAFEVERKGAVK